MPVSRMKPDKYTFLKTNISEAKSGFSFKCTCKCIDMFSQSREQQQRTALQCCWWQGQHGKPAGTHTAAQGAHLSSKRSSRLPPILRPDVGASETLEESGCQPVIEDISRSAC